MTDRAVLQPHASDPSNSVIDDRVDGGNDQEPASA